MGLASIPRPRRGICFPSSRTSLFHGVFFPTAENEQCFQLHCPAGDLAKAMDTWGTLTADQVKTECRAVAEQLRADGWHEDYVQPLEHATNAVRIGFSVFL